MTTVSLSKYQSPDAIDEAALDALECERVAETEFPIDLTDEAVKMVKSALQETDAEDGEFLRVGIKGGGCSGYYYVYDFATKIRPNKDLVFDFDGLKVVVDNRSIEFLAGAVLDWEQSLMSYGFKWKNPNATGDCGCGESFEVD